MAAARSRGVLAESCGQRPDLRTQADRRSNREHRHRETEGAAQAVGHATGTRPNQVSQQ